MYKHLQTKAKANGYKQKKIINQPIQRFSLLYFDLILIYWNMTDNLGVFRTLKEAYKQGKFKAVDLSNSNEGELL